MSESANSEIYATLLDDESQRRSWGQELIVRALPAGDTAVYFMRAIDLCLNNNNIEDVESVEGVSAVLKELLDRLGKCDETARNAWLNGFFKSLMFENPKEVNYPKVRKNADKYIQTFISKTNSAEPEVKCSIHDSISSIISDKFEKSIDNESHFIRDVLFSPVMTLGLVVGCAVAFFAGVILGPMAGVIGSIFAIIAPTISAGVVIRGKKEDYEKLCEQKNAISNSVDGYKNPEAPSQEQPTPEKLPVKEQVQQAQDRQNEINESDVLKVGDKITEKNDERN